jgi:hypothetical protein
VRPRLAKVWDVYVEVALRGEPLTYPLGRFNASEPLNPLIPKMSPEPDEALLFPPVPKDVGPVMPDVCGRNGVNDEGPTIAIAAPGLLCALVLARVPDVRAVVFNVPEPVAITSAPDWTYVMVTAAFPTPGLTNNPTAASPVSQLLLINCFT